MAAQPDPRGLGVLERDPTPWGRRRGIGGRRTASPAVAGISSGLSGTSPAAAKDHRQEHDRQHDHERKQSWKIESAGLRPTGHGRNGTAPAAPRGTVRLNAAPAGDRASEPSCRIAHRLPPPGPALDLERRRHPSEPAWHPPGPSVKQHEDGRNQHTADQRRVDRHRHRHAEAELLDRRDRRRAGRRRTPRP